MILTIRCKLHETGDSEDDARRESPEISVDNDTPPDLIPSPHYHDQCVSTPLEIADRRPYQQRVCEPIRKDIGYVRNLIDTDRKHLFLVRTRAPGEPTIIDKRQLRKLGIGPKEEGSKHELDGDIDEEKEVSSMTGILAFESIPEGIKAEPEKGHDDTVARSGDECAGEPCLFCGELGRRLGWGVGHV